MLVQYDFAVIQLRYLKAAMDEIPSYRPDGQTPAQIQTLISSAASVRGLYITAKTTLEGARALRRTSIDSLHGACIDFNQQARNAYRKNPTVTECLERLPTNDQSFQQTLTRADMVLAQWAQLPQIGTPPAAFTVAQGSTTLTMAGMATLRTTAETTDTNIPVVDQDFQLQEALLHAKQKEMDDQVTSALTQGRSQFPEGTPEREIIDAIPTESPRNLPGRAEINAATNPNPGEAVLDYDCAGATSFDIFMKPPESTDFVLVAEDIIVKTHTFTGLPANTPPDRYGFYVRGRNARGFGEDSEAVFMDII